MARNKFILFFLLIISNYILTIDKEKKWLFGGITAFLACNFLIWRYENKQVDKELQEIQERLSDSQAWLQESARMEYHANVTIRQTEKLEEKKRYITEHRMKYLLSKMTGISTIQRPLPGFFYLLGNILGVHFLYHKIKEFK